MKTNVHFFRVTGTLYEDQCTFFLSYLAHVFLEREMFHINAVKKVKAHIL
jgi:hypothetical protein